MKIIHEFIVSRNLRFFIASLICWILLAIFFDTKNVWGVLIIAGMLYFVNMLVKLHVHNKINKNYNVTCHIRIDDLISSCFYIAPLFIVFLFSYYLKQADSLRLPSASVVFITFVISLWISWIESVVLTNSFIIQIINSFNR